ncbi:TonB-dependent receptor [Exilibacterium tricleocarpae]|nr:TonB-dependent receptor [Exilibacterium tricleocarpae]
MHRQNHPGPIALAPALLLAAIAQATGADVSADRTNKETSGAHALEEVIVTAQKREQSLQEAPIAISVLGARQLEVQGISSLDALGDGAIPSLRVQPFANTPSTLNIAIRGNGPADVGQITREYPVAIYLDGVYLGRAQGLGMDLASLERIEVLRGPQGTLFGRNATGGAVNLISQAPTGELGIKQVFGSGRFDEFRSATHINLPEFAGISARFDYRHAKRDGWVDNTAPGAADYNEYDKDTARLSLRWQPLDAFTLDYAYDYFDVEAAQNYLQMYDDSIIGLIDPTGRERQRQRETRFPIAFLEPTVTEQQAHTLTATWDISDGLTLKSLSAYRELDEAVRNNYAGVFYFNGLVFQEDIEQEQISQEFQLIGTGERLEWLAGLYYFKEQAEDAQQNLFTLDTFGCLTGEPLTPILPTNVFTTCGPGGIILNSVPLPPTLVDADSESYAAYGQATWTPPLLHDQLDLTLGLRYTEDRKSGTREQFVFEDFADDWEHFDFALTMDYHWTPNISTYLKRSTGYRAGGVSLRASRFEPYDEEVARTSELGLKSEFWNRRLRFNAAVFATDYKNMQIDFADPGNIEVIQTINARRKVSVDGLELDLTVTPIQDLVLGLSYTYLDGDMPPQPNPLATPPPATDPDAVPEPVLSSFKLTQTPKHAGAVTVDYSFAQGPWGKASAHFNATSTDSYAYLPLGFQRFDAYTLFNARLTIEDFKLGNSRGGFTLSLWGRNITDEKYIVYAAPVGGQPGGPPPTAITQVFGAPRTLGIDVTFEM